jgi:hypothetical protein
LPLAAGATLLFLAVIITLPNWSDFFFHETVSVIQDSTLNIELRAAPVPVVTAKVLSDRQDAGQGAIKWFTLGFPLKPRDTNPSWYYLMGEEHDGGRRRRSFIGRTSVSG